MTRLLALLGDPVDHSLSPAIQNAALRAADLDAVYVALRCGSADLAGLLRGIARADGGGNVTIPHKRAAFDVVEEPTETARRTGAVNTFWLEDGRIHGDNTDVEGFRAAVRELLGDGTVPERVLVVGAGGAARAAVTALLDGGCPRIEILNRTPGRAAELARSADPERVAVVGDAARSRAGPWSLVVNATPLGLDPGDPLPFDPAEAAGIDAALDLAYHPAETPWVRRARELGIPAADGGTMLVAQAAAAFRRWWRSEPPMGVMREALAARREPAP